MIVSQVVKEYVAFAQGMLVRIERKDFLKDAHGRPAALCFHINTLVKNVDLYAYPPEVLFRLAGFKSLHLPFNGDGLFRRGLDGFKLEYYNERLWENAARLAFVKRMVNPQDPIYKEF